MNVDSKFKLGQQKKFSIQNILIENDSLQTHDSQLLIAYFRDFTQTDIKLLNFVISRD